VDDYGVRKGFAKMKKLADLPKPKELAAYGEKWKPYRSVAAWYLWRAAEMKDLPMVGGAAKSAAVKVTATAVGKNAAVKVAAKTKRVLRRRRRVEISD
jgi:hypothetical protein